MNKYYNKQFIIEKSSFRFKKSTFQTVETFHILLFILDQHLDYSSTELFYLACAL